MVSVNNNAKAPLAFFLDLAKLLEQEPIFGDSHADDYLRVPTDLVEKEIAEQLMNENKIFFKIVDKLPYHLRCFK